MHLVLSGAVQLLFGKTFFWKTGEVIDSHIADAHREPPVLYVHFPWQATPQFIHKGRVNLESLASWACHTSPASTYPCAPYTVLLRKQQDDGKRAIEKPGPCDSTLCDRSLPWLCATTRALLQESSTPSHPDDLLQLGQLLPVVSQKVAGLALPCRHYERPA